MKKYEGSTLYVWLPAAIGMCIALVLWTQWNQNEEGSFSAQVSKIFNKHKKTGLSDWTRLKNMDAGRSAALSGATLVAVGSPEAVTGTAMPEAMPALHGTSFSPEDASPVQNLVAKKALPPVRNMLPTDKEIQNGIKLQNERQQRLDKILADRKNRAAFVKMQARNDNSSDTPEVIETGVTSPSTEALNLVRSHSRTVH